MAVGEECRKALKAIEEYERDVTSNVNYVKAGINNAVFSVKGKVPDPLEEAELLDAVCTFFSLKRDDMLNIRIFRWLFMSDLNDSKLHFLIKLVSLAACLPLTPVLELAAVWLKCYKSQASAAFTFNFLIDLDRVFLHNKKNTNNQILDPLVATFKSCPAFTEAFLMALTETFSFIDLHFPESSKYSQSVSIYQRLVPKSFSSANHPPSLFTLKYLCTHFFDGSANVPLIISQNPASFRALDYLFEMDRDGQTLTEVNKIQHHNLALRSAFGGFLRWVITYPLYQSHLQQNDMNCHHFGTDYDHAMEKIHTFLFTSVSNHELFHSSNPSSLLPPDWLETIVETIHSRCLPVTPASPTMETTDDMSAVPAKKAKIEGPKAASDCTSVYLKLSIQRLAEYALLLLKAKILNKEEIKVGLQPLKDHSFIKMLLNAM